MDSIILIKYLQSYEKDKLIATRSISIIYVSLH